MNNSVGFSYCRSFVILLYLCFNSLCSVQASSNISVEDAGKAVALLGIAIPDQFVEHGSVEQLKQALGLDAESVTEQILDKVRKA